MSKSVVVIDTPEKCINCPLLNSSDECIMQDEDANFSADTFGDLRAGCPLVELPEKIPEPIGFEEMSTSVKRVGWNACIDAIIGEED